MPPLSNGSTALRARRVCRAGARRGSGGAAHLVQRLQAPEADLHGGAAGEALQAQLPAAGRAPHLLAVRAGARLRTRPVRSGQARCEQAGRVQQQARPRVNRRRAPLAQREARCRHGARPPATTDSGALLPGGQRLLSGPLCFTALHSLKTGLAVSPHGPCKRCRSAPPCSALLWRWRAHAPASGLRQARRTP